MQHGSASFARVRAQAPGFKPGAQRRVHELMNDIPMRIAWTDGTIVATHAGLTRRWGVRRFGHAWTGMTARHIADGLNPACRNIPEAWPPCTWTTTDRCGRVPATGTTTAT